MRFQRSTTLVLGMGLAMILSLGTVLPSAAATTVPTLTGETLTGGSTSGNRTGGCPGGSAYAVSGTAAGPYPGTFTETGTFTSLHPQELTATFTITSGTTTITGSKTGGLPPVGCNFQTSYAYAEAGGPYTATIHTPGGDYHDEGRSIVHVEITGSVATLTESYTSSLTQPILIAPPVPTSKDQCKDGGWRNYPQFKNQGQCVRFVKHNNEKNENDEDNDNNG